MRGVRTTSQEWPGSDAIRDRARRDATALRKLSRMGRIARERSPREANSSISITEKRLKLKDRLKGGPSFQGETLLMTAIAATLLNASKNRWAARWVCAIGRSSK